MEKQLIIGISGGSGSGKTHFCNEFLKYVQREDIVLIKSDGYFKRNLPKMISPLTNKEYDDWNSLESLDYPKLLQDIQTQINLGIPIIIIEGAYIFSYDELRELINLKIFIDTDIDLRLYRRIKRNMKVFNFEMDDIATYFIEAAKFKEQIYSTPTKIYADVIFNGAKDFDLPVHILESYIKAKLSE